MAAKFKIYVNIILLFFVLNTAGIHAQILKDTSTINLIKKGIDYIYNFQFAEAATVCNNLSRLYPGHPVIYLMNGMKTYWENFPLLPTSAARVRFENDMRSCMELCEKNDNKDYETEYLLANLCARGMLLLFYVDNSLSLEVFPLTTSTYKYIRRSFDYTSASSDFLFFTGLYNYSREAYPEAYPIYKPLAMLFPGGDKLKGIRELQKAAKSSIVLRAESLSFLNQIFVSFENNYLQANYYIQTLYELYPGNLLYKEEYIKNLLLIKRYDEAEKIIGTSAPPKGNSYFTAQITIFNGILKEKKYHDLKSAQELYIKGAKDVTLYGNYGNEFASYAYFGLSRISEVNGDKNYHKMYRKLANELAISKKVNFD